MIALLWFVLAILASPFKSKSRLESLNVGNSARLLRRILDPIAKICAHLADCASECLAFGETSGKSGDGMYAYPVLSI